MSGESVGGAGVESVRFAASDLFGLGSCGTGASGLGTAIFATRWCGRLGVGRNGTGRLVGTAGGALGRQSRR